MVHTSMRTAVRSSRRRVGTEAARARERAPAHALSSSMLHASTARPKGQAELGERAPVMLVVSTLFKPKFAQNGVLGQNFARAASGGAEPIEECRVEVRYGHICCMVRLADGA